MVEIAYAGALDKTTFHFPRHVHKDIWEIVLYTQGCGTLCLDTNPVPFHAGQLVLIPPNTPHLEESPAGYQNVFVAAPSIPSALSSAEPILDTSNGALDTLFQMLLSEFHNSRPNRDGILSGTLRLIYQYLISFQRPDTSVSEVQKIAAILSANVSNASFSVSQLLSSFPLSEDYLRRLFKRETGCSPHEYLLDLRLDHACEMLNALGGNTCIIKEIAYACGFDDPLYFSRMFRKKKGCSPSQWKHKGYDPIAFVE